MAIVGYWRAILAGGLMNKTIVTISYFVLVLATLIMAGLVSIFRPEQLDVIIGFAGTILAVASSAAVTIYMLRDQAAALETVREQTGHTVTVLQSQAAEIQSVKAQTGDTAATIHNQARVIETVKAQTDGTISALQEENTRLTAQLLAVVGRTTARDA